MEADIKEAIQEKSVPELNELEQNLVISNKYFYEKIGAVTHPSVVRKDGDVFERSLLTRAIRAELVEKFYSIPKSDKKGRQEVIQEAKEREQIARAYLKQGDVLINLPELGMQKAKYVVIDPPESRKTSEYESKPPILLIPGISNDIDPVGGLAQEIAFMGRRAIVVAYPESTLGEITAEFAEESSRSRTYEPHVSFYKEVIKKFKEKGSLEVGELWGLSAGGPIAAKILTEEEYQQLFSNAVLLTPGGTYTQKKHQLVSGILDELSALKEKPELAAKYSLVLRRKESDKRGQGKLKRKVMLSLINKVCQKADFWDKARVREGGKIIVFSAGKDNITKSAQAEDELKKNPQITVINDPTATHITPLVEPQRVLKKIFKAQG